MNGPTLLTVARILVIPFIILFNYLDSPWSSWFSLLIFLLASLTDWLDGFLARRNNQITTLGKLLDPLADKLLVLTAFLVILERGFLPAWIVIIMIGREMAITGLRAFLAAEHIVLAAGRLGKWKMVVQVICLSLLFLGGENQLILRAGIFSAYAALFLSLLSAYLYIEKFWLMLGSAIMAEQQGKK